MSTSLPKTLPWLLGWASRGKSEGRGPGNEVEEHSKEVEFSTQLSDWLIFKLKQQQGKCWWRGSSGVGVTSKMDCKW